MRRPPSDTARTVLYTYALVVAAKSSMAALRPRRDRNHFLHGIIGVLWEPSTLKLAVFPSAISCAYHGAVARYEDAILAAYLAAPALLLVPSELRIQIALYAATSALVNRRKPSWALHLPPVWTLNVLGNAILICLFVRPGSGLQPSYERVVVSCSGAYIPPGRTKAELSEFLWHTDFPAVTKEQARDMKAHPQHRRLVCATLHPATPSCMETYLRGWVSESRKIWKWVGSFSALSIILSMRNSGRTSPIQLLVHWLNVTLRGTAFVVGSINTAWALTCLSQRLIPGNVAPRLRWAVNGMITSLWILVLPNKRRQEIALYVARFAALNSVQWWKSRGGMTIPFGEVLLFAVALASLMDSSDINNRISGPAGLLVRHLDGRIHVGFSRHSKPA